MSVVNFKSRMIPVNEKEGVRIIHIAGEVDESSINEFKKEINRYLQTKDVKTFIFFLRDLEFINSMVVGFLAEVFSTLNQDGKKMVLAESNDTILDILEVVGFLNLVEYHPTIQEAIDSLDV